MLIESHKKMQSHILGLCELAGRAGRSIRAQQPGPSAGPPPDGVRRRWGAGSALGRAGLRRLRGARWSGPGAASGRSSPARRPAHLRTACGGAGGAAARRQSAGPGRAGLGRVAGAASVRRAGRGAASGCSSPAHRPTRLRTASGGAEGPAARWVAPDRSGQQLRREAAALYAPLPRRRQGGRASWFLDHCGDFEHEIAVPRRSHGPPFALLTIPPKRADLLCAVPGTAWR